MSDETKAMEIDHHNDKSKLANILDGNVEPEITDEEIARVSAIQNVEEITSASSTESTNRRLREVMLLTAVAEEYGSKLSIDADFLVNKFLGPPPKKVTADDKGPVDIEHIANDSNNSKTEDDNQITSENSESSTPDTKPPNSSSNLVERSKYIPLRLSPRHRKYLRLCEAALDVSEYTDKVDILTWKTKTGRIHEQIKDICNILSGLAIACNFDVGKKIMESRSYADYSEFFAMVFEIARRHKIMNPERMRTDYGKLIHLLMDSQSSEIQRILEFRLVKPIMTVYDFLKSRDALALLEHPDAVTATMAIIEDKLAGKTKYTIQQEIKAKNSAVKRLIHRFSTSNSWFSSSSSTNLSKEEIEWVLYSMGDNSSFLVFNRDPVEKMIILLKKYFSYCETSDDDSEREESSKTTSKTFPRRSLAIQSGHKGARLTHDHNRQYQFALQTMTLWREVQNDMFKLWCLAEDDLLDPDNYYSLRDTGQGLNRIQSAPRIGRAMSEILRRAQRSLGSWIGSSVVHLGDHNVPNALTFIDKYTQVPRILNPIVNVIEAIPQLVSENKGGLGDLIKKNYGSAEECQITILQDFFKHAFDGSGADNFYDAGSCIDGRLTSAWNWCNKLDKKDYYPIFKLAGFTGFDGNFKG